jgi:hypothetical protein
MMPLLPLPSPRLLTSSPGQVSNLATHLLITILGVQPFLIAVPCVIAVASVILFVITWKLFQEFGWSIYKQIGASVQMRQRFLIYQIFVALLKFDFFFCTSPSSSNSNLSVLGFEIQFLVIIISITDAEFGITIAAIPITIVILIFCAWSVRHESKVGMITTIFCFLGGLAYFLFKVYFLALNLLMKPAVGANVSTIPGVQVHTCPPPPCNFRYVKLAVQYLLMA